MTTKEPQQTSASNIEYNLVSVIYHKLESAVSTFVYVVDAQWAGDHELTQFFLNNYQEERRTADRAEQLLTRVSASSRANKLNRTNRTNRLNLVRVKGSLVKAKASSVKAKASSVKASSVKASSVKVSLVRVSLVRVSLVRVSSVKVSILTPVCTVALARVCMGVAWAVSVIILVCMVPA